MVNRIKILSELKKYPVFSVNTISRIINKKNDYSKLVAHRLKKSGLVFKLEKNKYTVHSDALLVSSHIVWPCYVSSWSAIRYHGMTEQIPNCIQIITTRSRKKRKIRFNNTTIEFIKIKKDNFFGFAKTPYRDFEIFMAEKEKAMADALYLKHASLETFLEILGQHKKELDIKKLVSYLKRMKMNRVVYKIKKEVKYY